MTAELLREAASLMRERALKAKAEPQTIHGGVVYGVWVRRAHYMTIPPAFALAVADWLDRTAGIAPPDPHHEGERCETCENVAAATAVARAYLGRDA